MKKLIAGIIVAGLLMTGCTFFRATMIKTDGRGIGGNYGLTSAKAKTIDAIFIGYTIITTEKFTKEFLNNLPRAVIKVDKDNKVKSVGVETNFTHKTKIVE